MPDWKQEINKRLAGLHLTASREVEIVEEMAQHADDRYSELLASGTSETQARQAVLEEIAGDAVSRQVDLENQRIQSGSVAGRPFSHSPRAFYEVMRLLLRGPCRRDAGSSCLPDFAILPRPRPPVGGL